MNASIRMHDRSTGTDACNTVTNASDSAPAGEWGGRSVWNVQD
jgi:hypothetical protein